MTPEAQRIAIAEACGWLNCETIVGRAGNRVTGGNPPGIIVGGLPWKELPDYLSDLNAIHEAEKTLTAEQQMTYARALHLNHSQRQLFAR